MNWAEVTSDHLIYVAQHLRRQDELEVRASHGIGPEEAVYDSHAASELCRAIEGDDGKPVAVTGIVPAEHGGLIWMLGTDELFATASHRRQFTRGGIIWLNGAVSEWGSLHNWVYQKNRLSMRWLQSLGFVLHPAAPRGPSAELFCYFERNA